MSQSSHVNCQGPDCLSQTSATGLETHSPLTVTDLPPEVLARVLSSARLAPGCIPHLISRACANALSQSATPEDTVLWVVNGAGGCILAALTRLTACTSSSREPLAHLLLQHSSAPGSFAPLTSVLFRAAERGCDWLCRILLQRHTPFGEWDQAIIRIAVSHAATGGPNLLALQVQHRPEATCLELLQHLPPSSHRDWLLMSLDIVTMRAAQKGDLDSCLALLQHCDQDTQPLAALTCADSAARGKQWALLPPLLQLLPNYQQSSTVTPSPACTFAVGRYVGMATEIATTVAAALGYKTCLEIVLQHILRVLPTQQAFKCLRCALKASAA